jgi:hypothetical protein
MKTSLGVLILAIRFSDDELHRVRNAIEGIERRERVQLSWQKMRYPRPPPLPSHLGGRPGPLVDVAKSGFGDHRTAPLASFVLAAQSLLSSMQRPFILLRCPLPCVPPRVPRPTR